MRSTTIATLFGVLLCAGCAASGTMRPDCEGLPVRMSAESLPVADRKVIRPNVDAVPLPGDRSVISAGPLHRIQEYEAQCLAARHSRLAALLVEEAAVLGASSDRRSACTTQLIQQLLWLEAEDRRNADAGSSLTVLLRLVEAEGGADNLVQRLHQLNALSGEIKSLTNRGLRSAVSAHEIEDQRLLLLHRQAELEITIGQLRQQLASLLGLAELEVAFWPDVDLAVLPDELDADQAVNLALANRPDLAALRLAACAEPDVAAEAERLLLRQASPALGIASSPCRILPAVCRSASSCEGWMRSGQIAQLLLDRERTAERETRQAVTVVASRWRQIAWTKQRLATIQLQVADAQRQRELVPEAILTVRQHLLKRLEVEQDLLHDVIEYKLALVQLKQAQGLLSSECLEQ